MSTPITPTEFHLGFAKTVLFSRDAEGKLMTAEMVAQLFAEAEARAVQIAMLREYGNLSATNESLAKERDQLRAEVERLRELGIAAAKDGIGHFKLAEKADAECAEQKWLKECAIKRAKELVADLATEREKVRVLREALAGVRATIRSGWIPEHVEVAMNEALAATEQPKPDKGDDA